MITTKFQPKTQILMQFTQPTHFVTHGFTVLAVLTFVRFFNHNSLNLNPNDSILNSKHIYTKFPTNMDEPYNFPLTRNTPESSSKFQADSSLAIFKLHVLPLSQTIFINMETYITTYTSCMASQSNNIIKTNIYKRFSHIQAIIHNFLLIT